MHRLSIFILLILSPSLVLAHELCADFSGPKAFPGTLGFCTEYNDAPDNGKTCCQPTDEDNLRATVNGLGITAPLSDCPDMLRKLFCTKCDPWQAHLYGAEQNPSAPLPNFGKMCVDWCGYLYHACSEQYMHWNNTPSGVNLFGGSSPYLKDDWPTQEAFCNVFAIPPTDPVRENCFWGVPYVPNPPPKAPADAQPICFEYWAASSWEPIVTAIADPMDATDRLFVAYQPGQMDVFKRSTGERIGNFLTIPNVLKDGEAGFTAVAFHPNFKTNGRFFVHYSSPKGVAGNVVVCDGAGEWCGSGLNPACVDGGCAADHFSIIAEYKVSTTDANRADPTEKRLLVIPQPFRIHNLGALLFGPDGFLYIAMGDGGNFNDPNNRAQTLNTLLGKVLRIDVDATPDIPLAYAIPAANPFYNTAGAWGEIFAYGFRNPWQCSFDNDRLICGDVGQDDVEEINLVKPGLDYGWRVWEGTQPTINNANNATAGFTFSAVEYTHDFLGGNAAVIAGHVYRGSRYPGLVGTLVSADHSGVVWAMPQKQGNADAFDLKFLRPVCALSSPACTPDVGNIFTIGQDTNGDLYFSTSKGILRVVELSRCNETFGTAPNGTQPPVPTTGQTAAPSTTQGTTTSATQTTKPPATTSTGNTAAPSTTTASPTSTTTRTATLTTGDINFSAGSMSMFENSVALLVAALAALAFHY